MTPVTILCLSLVAVILLTVSGIPIAFVLALVAGAGIIYLNGVGSLLFTLGSFPIGRVTEYGMIVIPLFILMGEMAYASGTASDAYEMANRWLGRLKGGLVIVSLGAMGMIAACTGSGVTGTVAMGKIAVPEMRKFGYDIGLCTGAVAAGGTVGVMIPPSIPLVVYGITTMTPIGKLLIAGVLPGILLVFMYMLMVYIRCWRNPNLAPAGQKFSWKERIVAMPKAWGVILIFVIVVGGLYGGVVTPMEVGAIASLVGLILWVLARLRGRSDWIAVKHAVYNTARLSSMIFALLIGGGLFSLFIVMTGAMKPVVSVFVNLPLPPILIVFLISMIYVPLGMFIDGLSMILITMPIFFPIVVSGLGFNPIWFGILVTCMGELGAITPPMAVNLFVAKGVFPDIPIETIIRGAFPFMLMDLVVFCILFAFPIISTWLPSMMS